MQVAPFDLLADHSVPVDLDTEHGIALETVEDAYSSTPLQEGMMTLSILKPGAYVLRRVLKVSSSIDLARFQAAWELSRSRIPFYEPD
jgi:hypothetical protein